MPSDGFLFDAHVDNTIITVLSSLKLLKARSIREFRSLHKFRDGKQVSISDYTILDFCLKRSWTFCTVDHSMLLDPKVQLSLPSNRTPLVILPEKLKHKDVREKAIWILQTLPKLKSEVANNRGDIVIFLDLYSDARCVPIEDAIKEVEMKKRTKRTNFKDERRKLREASEK